MVTMAHNASQKPEYKQTEVGVIPEDWEVKLLGEIAIVSSGGTPDRSNPTYWNGDVPWVTTTQINFNLIDTANEFITRKGHSDHKSYLSSTS
jgi:type I restriction enzyme, S subunit